METKFTGGDWKYLKTGLNETCIFSDIDMEHIFKINHNEVEGSQAEGNVKLIAAAPKLFEALISIENDNGSIPKAIWDLRNEAIKLATE